MGKRVLVVGGVAGGASAAARIRHLDSDAAITVFERGDHVLLNSAKEMPADVVVLVIEPPKVAVIQSGVRSLLMFLHVKASNKNHPREVCRPRISGLDRREPEGSR